MKKCKYCKTEIDKKAKICPQCGRPQGHTVGAIVAVILITCVLLFIVAISSDDEPETGGSAGGDNAKVNPYSVERVLVEEDSISAKFIKVYEEDYIEGMLYFALEVENNLDEQVWVACDSAEFNGYSTLVMSGVPLTINAGTKGIGAFFVNEENISLENLEDLEEMKFKIVVYSSDSMDELYRSDELCITFK